MNKILILLLKRRIVRRRCQCWMKRKWSWTRTEIFSEENRKTLCNCLLLPMRTFSILRKILSRFTHRKKPSWNNIEIKFRNWKIRFRKSATNSNCLQWIPFSSKAAEDIRKPWKKTFSTGNWKSSIKTSKTRNKIMKKSSLKSKKIKI